MVRIAPKRYQVIAPADAAAMIIAIGARPVWLLEPVSGTGREPIDDLEGTALAAAASVIKPS
jgi:hypothetical protein